jgi:uncharacterized repeat protein (TIGR01451 family)
VTIDVTSIDVTPPTTTISSKPPNPSNQSLPTFAFSANEVATSTCQLDGGGFAPCTSPVTYNSLNEGIHTFEVYGTDTSNNVEQPPKSYSWRIDLTPPVITVPADMTVYGDGGPQTVTFDATATDGYLPPSPAVSCSPASGTTFTLGTTTVNCEASDAAGNKGTASFKVTVASRPDLVLRKGFAPDPVGVGATLTYTLSVENRGPGSATDVVVTDTLPQGTVFLPSSSDARCQSAGQTVACHVQAIAAGSADNWTIQVKAPNTPGTITNTATVTCHEGVADTTHSTKSVTTTVSRPELQLSLSLDSGDPAGTRSVLTYRLQLINVGLVDATGVVVTDPLPAGATFVSASDSRCQLVGADVKCTLGNVPAGSGWTFILISMTAPSQPGTITNTVTVTSNEGATAAATRTTTVSRPNLVLTKSGGPDPVEEGKTLTYLLSLVNNGPVAATAVQVTDTLPDGAVFLDSNFGSSANCSAGSGTPVRVTCTMAGLDAYRDTYFYIIVTAPSTPGRIVTNVASVTSNEWFPNAAATASVSTGISKTVSQDVSPGGSVTTDKENDGVSSTDPLETTVTTPTGGTVQIIEQPTTATPPTGWGFLGEQVTINAADANATNPLVISFLIDASIASNQTQNTIEVYKNGVLVPDCTGAGANPDPCVAARMSVTGGFRLTIHSSTASVWNLAYLLSPPTIADLSARIEAAGLDPGETRSLEAKLTAAGDARARGQAATARNQIGAVINEVEALKRSKRLNVAVANSLIARAQMIARRL